MRHTWFLPLIAIALAVVTWSSVSAAELPSVDPSACTIAPIPVPVEGEVGDLSTPQPTPTPIATAPVTPADDATAAAITETIAQSIACRNAGDQLRMLATFSDRWVAALFSGYDLVFYNQFLDQVDLPATPLATADQITLVAIDDIGLRDDGAALATVTTRSGGVEQRSLLLLIEESGVWRIDGADVAA